MTLEKKQGRSRVAKSESYAGIDYGMGTANVDRETGIRYGVISQHSVNIDCWAEAEAVFGEPSCPECGDTVVEYDETKHGEYTTNPSYAMCADYACDGCKLYWESSWCYPEEPLGYSYERDGYKLTDCLDSDIFVLRSPYYTFAQFCSPCVPGAGNLDNPTPHGTGAKCYALGHDWFESERAPYPLWDVRTGKRVSRDPRKLG